MALFRQFSAPRPLGWLLTKKFFVTNYFHLIKMKLFCDKSYLVRPTSNLLKLKNSKIAQFPCDFRIIRPLGGYLGVQKFFWV